ncbi:MAG: hypothetical protein ACYC2T_02560 [Bacillota bacterium]
MTEPTNKKIRLAAIAVIVLVIAAVVFVSFKMLPTESQPTLSAEHFPTELVGMPAVHQVVTGEEAIQQLGELHGKDINKIVNGYIAMYEQGDRQITLWISQSATEEDANELFGIMDAKMPSSKVFTNYETVELNGNTYKYVSGIGMDNYYFVHGNDNYWVAIKDPDSMSVLEKVVETFIGGH